jgi:hypothetical protein
VTKSPLRLILKGLPVSDRASIDEDEFWRRRVTELLEAVDTIERAMRDEAGR